MGHDGEDADLSTSGVHLVAGSAAGIAEHVVMYPIDIVKTRLQSLNNIPYKNTSHALWTMVKEGGFRSTLRGLSVPLVGAGPAHAAYFSSYELTKQAATRHLNGHSGKNSRTANTIAACVATVFHDVVMTPTDVVKQRMQMVRSEHASCRACVRDVYRKEGIRAFYRSFTTQLTINVPFQIVHFVLYEEAEELLNPGRGYNPPTHMLSGALAGGVAAFVTNPLDVCKTLLNTQQHSGSVTVRGLPAAIRTVYALNGWRTFGRGVGARVLFQMPSTAISWSVYELFKRHIFLHTSRDGDDGPATL